MKTTAAVAFAPGRELEICEIDLGPPAGHEVLVEIIASGIGPADRLTWSGQDPDGRFPFVPGHEALGRVIEVGREVRSLAPGDMVVPLVIPECGRCEQCLSGRTNLCQALRSTQGRGVMPDGRTRFSLAGAPVYHYMGVSSFARHTVLPEISAARIDVAGPPEELAVFCGPFVTGMGAVFNTARLGRGESVAVFGLGPIGLGVVAAAASSGAGRIIAIDPSAAKQGLARRYGATDAFAPSELGPASATALHDLTAGGVDAAFECVGDAEVLRSAIEATRKGWGRTIVLGVVGNGTCLNIPPVHFVLGRTVTGCAYGGLKGRSDLQQYLEAYESGRIPAAPLVSERIGMAQVPAAFAGTVSPDTVRTVVVND